MSRETFFSSPFMLGFDEVERVLDRIGKSTQDGYPPYNIEECEGATIRIVLAVAGFTKEDLAVTLEDNQLVIRGQQADDQDKNYLHRGIAARQFQKTFVLADGIEIVGANLDNGLLAIDLVRPISTTEVKTIEIKSNKAKTNGKDSAIDLVAEDAAE